MSWLALNIEETYPEKKLFKRLRTTTGAEKCLN
jgi:hypothetical protein